MSASVATAYIASENFVLRGDRPEAGEGLGFGEAFLGLRV